MIGDVAPDDLPAIAVALGYMVGAGKSNRGIDRFTTSAKERGLGESGREPMLYQLFDKRDPVLGGPERNHVVDVAQRFGGCLNNVGTSVANVAYDRSASRVEYAVAVVANEPYALGAVDDEGRFTLGNERESKCSMCIHDACFNRR